jgi:hypothetical protein
MNHGNNETTLCDTALVYLQTEVEHTVWHPPLVQQWDFTLVKAYDEKFTHYFPEVLHGSIFKVIFLINHKYKADQ